MACHAEKEFLKAEKEHQTKTLQNLLWNVSIQNCKMARISFKPEFQLIANEPEKDSFDKLRRVRDSNPRCLATHTLSKRAH